MKHSLLLILLFLSCYIPTIGQDIPCFSTSNFLAGVGTMSLISVDLNGDGHADLAASNWYSNNVSVLLGNGDGSFKPTYNFHIPPNYPSSITSNDFNQDDNADLAIANPDSYAGNSPF